MDLSSIKLPSWLLPSLQRLMGLAEDLFGPGTGVAKKRWVRAAMLDALRSVDVPKVPDWIENPLKEALVDFLIEVVWSLHFQGPEVSRIARPGFHLPA
ncbi:MAG: hypothetical protein Q8P41_25725 [Pseudomonadota bacterium]|nr:hypothetical protein [Pseudomonadota bacterium]